MVSLNLGSFLAGMREAVFARTAAEKPDPLLSDHDIRELHRMQSELQLELEKQRLLLLAHRRFLL